jgi:glutathione S-transferase
VTILLYSTAFCPFAHRTRLTLAEKGLEPRLIEIDLWDKPHWFNALSPHGKVPLLKIGEDFLWESAVIDEYLEERFPRPALLPGDLLSRARARAWIRFADTRLYEHSRRLLYSRRVEEQNAAREAIAADLQFMEDEGFARATARGPYWLGARYSLVDITFLPWFERRIVLERFRGFVWPESCQRLLDWYSNVEQLANVRLQSRTDDFYIQHYAALAGARA